MDLMDALAQVDKQAAAAGIGLSVWERIRLAFDIIFPPKDRPVALPPGQVIAPQRVPTFLGIDIFTLAIGGLILYAIMRKRS